MLTHTPLLGTFVVTRSKDKLMATAASIFGSRMVHEQVLSSLDAGQAVVTFYTIALLLAGVHDLRTHLCTILALFSIFAHCWRKTAVISLVLVLLVVPHSL